jgi:hypothetical protein
VARTRSSAYVSMALRKGVNGTVSGVSVNAARLAAVLRKDPRRINEADQLASEVEDKRMLDDNHSKYLLVTGVHGNILTVPDITIRLPGMPK